MISKTLKLSFLVILFSSLFFACNSEQEKSTQTENSKDESEKTEKTENTENVTKTESPAICLWAKLSVKKTPSLKGKWMASMYLGEKATFTGVTQKDSTVKKGGDYIQVKLADGKIGWVDSRFMAIDGKKATMLKESKIYDRPDILTASKHSFEKMQFVVITEEKEDWRKVIGKRAEDNWFKAGWVKEKSLTTSDLDVAVAVLENRANLKKDKQQKVDALQEIVDNSDFASSFFIADIRQIISDLTAPEEETPEENPEVVEEQDSL